MLASAAHLLGDRWLSVSDKKRIDWTLNGAPDIEFQINVNLFQSLLSPNQTIFCNFACLFQHFSFFASFNICINLQPCDRM